MATQTYASLTCQALQHYLVQQSPDWRRPIQNLGSGGDGSFPAVQQLQTLLETLPELIRTLTQQYGGARAMLPPVLHGRNRQDGDDDDAASPAQPDDDHHSAATASSSSFSDDTNKLICAADFVWPSDATNHSNLAASGRPFLLQRNPLALLLSESKDIVQPWHLPSDKKNNKNIMDDDDDVNMRNRNTEDEQETFVLNISYAGNEALESLVRVRLVANPVAIKELECVLATTSDGNDDAALIMSTANLYRQHPLFIDCLTFYGYILWKETT